MAKLTDKLQALANTIYRIIPQKTPATESLQKTKLVAHRGCWNNSDRIENTLPAFDYCLGKNIWAIEFDIRFSKDNVPMVHHDASLKRVFSNNRQMSDLNFLEIRKSFPQIPTLIEVATRYQSKLHFMIELKTIPTPEQVDNLQRDLVTLTPAKDYHFMSLDFEIFKTLYFAPKETFVSIGRTNLKSIHQQSLVEGIGAVTGQYLLLSNKMKQSCHELKIKVGTGFPDSKNLLYREINRGVDWIFTNEADKLSTLLCIEK